MFMMNDRGEGEGVIERKLLVSLFPWENTWLPAGIDRTRPRPVVLKMDLKFMQAKVGRMSQLFRCAVVLLAILVLSQAELNAELLPAREHIGLIKLRGMIDDEGSVFERLWSWSEFASLNVTSGAQAKTLVHDVVESLDEHIQPRLDLPPILVVNHSRASNSRD